MNSMKSYPSSGELSSLEDLTDSLHRGANKVYELAQLLQLSLDKIQSIISKINDPHAKVKLFDDECEIIQAQLSSYDDSFFAAKNFITTYIKKLDTILSVLTPTIKWIPEVQTAMEMVYKDGSTPWSFSLVHSGENLKSIATLLRQHFSNNSLQPLSNVAEGDFICCYDRRVLFRGVVLNILPGERVRVLNVDNNHQKILKKDSIFDLTEDLIEIPAQCIRCCLRSLNSEDEKLWHEELNHIFKANLSECKLSVNVIDRIDTLPPKFVVDVFGRNESYEAAADFGSWISRHVLPELKDLRGKTDSSDVLSLMRDDALDPFHAVEDSSESPTLDDHDEKPVKVTSDPLQPNTSDLEVRYYDKDIHQKGEPNFMPPNIKVDLNRSEMSKNAESNTDVQNVPLENHELGNVIPIKDNSISQEDTSVCQFYMKNRYCWKPRKPSPI